jgi:uncharacterized protein DUF4062
MESINVFVSSTFSEFALERDAVRKAIDGLPLTTPVLFEELPASERTASEVVRDEIAKSDIFIILLGDRLSPSVAFEYEIAHALNKPILFFARKPSNPDETLRSFIEAVAENRIVSTFVSADELTLKVGAALLNLFVDSYRKFALRSFDFVEPLYKKEIETRAEKTKPDKKLCFVIMPIGKQGTKEYDRFKAIFDAVIKPAVEINDQGKLTGLRCERADQEIRTGSIPRDIVEKLASAEIVIADLTTKNPNVFYELGVRHSLKQKTIMIAQSEDDIPFDVREYRTIFYDPTVGLAEKSTRDIRSTVKVLLASDNVKDSPVMDWI